MKQLSRQRQIKKIEKKEGRGPFGEWRKDFCKKYPALIMQIQNRTRHSLAGKLDAEDSRITCQKGCTHCCHHYVTVSLAHGIAIVDYLYKRRKRLANFLDNYDKWLEKGYHLADRIDRERMFAQSASKPVDQVLQETRPLARQYVDLRIPCPFLSDGGCFIYDIRPLSCSGHFSTSPPGWCAPNSVEKPQLHTPIPDDSDLMEIIRLADPRFVTLELTLPLMIHKLLVAGTAAVMNEVLSNTGRME